MPKQEGKDAVADLIARLKQLRTGWADSEGEVGDAIAEATLNQVALLLSFGEQNALPFPDSIDPIPDADVELTWESSGGIRKVSCTVGDEYFDVFLWDNKEGKKLSQHIFVNANSLSTEHEVALKKALKKLK